MSKIDLKPYRRQMKSAKAVMTAAGHPTRLAILEKLCKEDIRYSEIARKMKISDSLASLHLKILRSNDLVRHYRIPSKKARTVMYTLSPRVDQSFIDAVKVISLEK
jgi:DNA-binding transcriptional ArsR family regulator